MASPEETAAGDGPVPHAGTTAGSAPQRRRLVARTVTITAVVTFVATQLAGWAISRVADSVAGAATPALSVESSGPIVSPWDVTIPQSPDEVAGALVRPETIARWALNQGGGPSNRVRIELVVSGTRDRAVLLEGISATDVDCATPPAWTAIAATVGGEVPVREVEIDLDAGRTQGMPKADPSFGEEFRFPLQVSSTSLEFFTVTIRSTAADCRFRLRVDFRDGGTRGSQLVDDGGRPFRVISPRSAAAHMEWHATEGGLWTPTKVVA